MVLDPLAQVDKRTFSNFELFATHLWKSITAISISKLGNHSLLPLNYYKRKQFLLHEPLYIISEKIDVEKKLPISTKITNDF